MVFDCVVVLVVCYYFLVWVVFFFEVNGVDYVEVDYLWYELFDGWLCDVWFVCVYVELVLYGR